jgi:hypothetical protein
MLKALRTRFIAYSFLAIMVGRSVLLSAAAADSTLSALIDAGHWKRARPIAEQRYQANPNDAEAAYLLSEVKIAFGDLEGALALAEKAVALAPKDSRFHRQLADACGLTAEKASLFSKAHWARRMREEAETSASLDPKNLDARFDLLEFYIQAPRLMGGGQDKARAMADEIARIDPVSGFQAQARLAREHKDVTKEQEEWANAAAAHPTSYDTLIAIANFYLRPQAGDGGPHLDAAPGSPADMGEADKFARQAARAEPGRVAAYAVLARVYAFEQRWKDLDSVLIEAEKNVPDNFRPYYRAAQALLATDQDLARAERYFRKYLSQEPEPDSPSLAEAQKQLGLVLEKKGRKP